MLSEDQKWLVVSSGAAMVAAAATRFLISAGWRTVTRREPPQYPTAPHVRWSDAVAWAVVTGTAASLARLLAERGSAEGWRRVGGRYPRAVRRKRARR